MATVGLLSFAFGLLFLLLGFLITFIDGQSNYFWFCSFMISIGFFDRRIGRGDIIAGILFGAFSASFLATS